MRGSSHFLWASAKKRNKESSTGFGAVGRLRGAWVTPFDVRPLLMNLLSCRSISTPLCAAAVIFFGRRQRKETKKAARDSAPWGGFGVRGLHRLMFGRCL